MKLFCDNENYKIYNGGMLDMLEVIKPNSIDSIVCDPPYELGFMGKSWDKSGIAFQKETWEKCFEVLKDGGYLLAFGGSRTFHRIAVAIEDAGFEIRDTIMWLYGSGFPKSHNISKAIDKKLGADDLAKKYAGYGTCLKPAYEPIIVARKPFKTTVAENIMENGVGGINIDECRVETGEQIAVNVGYKSEIQSNGWGVKKCITELSNRRRFPANIIHDNSEEVISGFNDSGSASRYFYSAKASKKDRDEGLDLFEDHLVGSISGGNNDKENLDDVSNRFRTIKKNIHPTVKPTELMQYLVRLVSPKGSTILDCFMGSGSTGKAVMFENRERNADYKFIGIDLEEEYCQIASARIDYALNKYEYDFKQGLSVAKQS